MAAGVTRYPVEVLSVRLASDARIRDFVNADVAFIPVTRFNLRLNSKKESRSAHLDGRHLFESPDYNAFWLNRIDIFERLCVPSVLNLSPRPDAWFIAFGETRPTYIQELIERLQIHPWIKPYVRQKGYPEARTPLKMMLSEHVRSIGKHYLCSTRFDSDDSLHTQFYNALDRAISQLRSREMDNETRCLNLLYGLVESRGDLSIYLRRTNMFESIYESVERLEGPYRGSHDRIRELMPLVEIITNLPMWMYHRHGDNLDPPGVIVRDRVRLPLVPQNLAPFGLTKETMAAQMPADNTPHPDVSEPSAPDDGRRRRSDGLRTIRYWNAAQCSEAIDFSRATNQPNLAIWLEQKNAGSAELTAAFEETERGDFPFLNAASLAALANDLLQSGFFVQALRLYDSAVQLSPNDRHLRSTRDTLAGALQDSLDDQEQRELTGMRRDSLEQTTAVVLVTMAAGPEANGMVSDALHDRCAALVQQGFSPCVVMVPDLLDECGHQDVAHIERHGVLYRSLGNGATYPTGRDAFRRALTRELADIVAELRPCLLSTDGSFTAKVMTAAVARAFSIPVEF